MLDLPIDQRVRQCYESALDCGLAEKAAIDAALVLWRTGRPEESLDSARRSVSHIIAQARIERRTGQPVDPRLVSGPES
jgi:hypothetical protein